MLLESGTHRKKIFLKPIIRQKLSFPSTKTVGPLLSIAICLKGSRSGMSISHLLMILKYKGDRGFQVAKFLLVCALGYAEAKNNIFSCKNHLL